MELLNFSPLVCLGEQTDVNPKHEEFELCKNEFCKNSLLKTSKGSQQEQMLDLLSLVTKVRLCPQKCRWIFESERKGLTQTRVRYTAFLWGSFLTVSPWLENGRVPFRSGQENLITRSLLFWTWLWRSCWAPAAWTSPQEWGDVTAQLHAWLGGKWRLHKVSLGWPLRGHHFGFFLALPSESSRVGRQRLETAPWKTVLTDPNTFFSDQTHF